MDFEYRMIGPDGKITDSNPRARGEAPTRGKRACDFVCTKDFNTRSLPGYEGELQEYRRGRTRVAAGHPAISAHPDAFAKAGTRAAEAAIRSSRSPRRRRNPLQPVEAPPNVALRSTSGARGLQTPLPRSVRGEDIWDLGTVRFAMGEETTANRQLRDRAMRAIERSTPRHGAVQDHDAARDHIAGLLDALDAPSGDPRASFAGHILRTGSPAYRQTFGKLLRGQHLNTSEQRSLLVGADGGYVLPFEIDPTIVPSSNPTRNPLRALSRVVQTTENIWKGVTSGTVAGGYGPEVSEVVDGSPTLAQPEITCARGTAYIESAFELGQDLGNIEPALAGVLQRAKDDAEAVKLLTGDGEDEPLGLLTALDEEAEVETAEKAKLVVADVEALEAELDDDFLGEAQFLGHRQVFKALRKTDAGGGAGFWVKLPGSRPELLDYTVNYCGTMAEEVKASAKPLILGDFSHFVIADRIGMSIKLIPNVPGEHGRPTGKVGVLALWRNGSALANEDAFRVLTVKAS